MLELNSLTPDNLEILLNTGPKWPFYIFASVLVTSHVDLKRAVQDCSWAGLQPVGTGNILQIQVSHYWWMPAGQMFDLIPLPVCVCERLIKMSLDLTVTPSVDELIVWQSANNPLMLWEGNRKSNRVKNFHKWASFSKAYRASWHNDCSYISSCTTLELIPSFSLLCSKMSSCRQSCG